MSLHCVFYPWQLFKELNPESCCRAPVQNVPHITSYTQQKTKSLELIKLIIIRSQVPPHCLWLPLARPWELCRAHKCPSPSPDRLSWLDNVKNLTLKSSLKIQSLSLASKLAIEPRVRRTCSAVPKGVDGAWFQYFDLNFFCLSFHQFQTCRPKGFLNFAIWPLQPLNEWLLVHLGRVSTPVDIYLVNHFLVGYKWIWLLFTIFMKCNSSLGYD